MSESNPGRAFPDPAAALTQILVVSDIDRSTRFWTDIVGAEFYREYAGTSVVLRLAGAWLLLVTGGGPSGDKPTITLAAPGEPDTVSHAMTLRVADCQQVYAELTDRGADFLTPPHDWGAEIRCYLRDPDGHLIELSEARG